MFPRDVAVRWRKSKMTSYNVICLRSRRVCLICKTRRKFMQNSLLPLHFVYNNSLCAVDIYFRLLGIFDRRSWRKTKEKTLTKNIYTPEKVDSISNLGIELAIEKHSRIFCACASKSNGRSWIERFYYFYFFLITVIMNPLSAYHSMSVLVVIT